MKYFILILAFLFVGCSDTVVSPVDSQTSDGSYYYFEIYQTFEPGGLDRALIILDNSFTTLDSLHSGGYHTSGFRIEYNTDGKITIGSHTFTGSGSEQLHLVCNKSYIAELH